MGGMRIGGGGWNEDWGEMGGMRIGDDGWNEDWGRWVE